MTENTGQSRDAELQGELRRKLIKRLAMAGILVAILLGVLAFFDYLATPEEPEEIPSYGKVVPVPPKKELTQPVKPGGDLPEPSKTVEAAPAPAVAPALPAPGAPVLQPEAPAKPVVSAQPVLPAQETAPAPRVAPAKPVQASVPTKELASVPESTAAPIATVVEEAPAAKPAAKVMEVAPRTAPHPARLLSGYILQAGVFASAQRAEELHAKLTLNGIPSTMEARVQVGPFKTKAEADAAREKLKALGIDSVLLPPAGKH